MAFHQPTLCSDMCRPMRSVMAPCAPSGHEHDPRRKQKEELLDKDGTEASSPRTESTAQVCRLWQMEMQ